MPSETTTACVSLLVFFRIRRGTFPYGVEDDASIISQIPTTHYTSTCVKLTIVTHPSFSERIAIANLYLIMGSLHLFAFLLLFIIVVFALFLFLIMLWLKLCIRSSVLGRDAPI